MTNKNRNVLYIGVTSKLYWRIQEHKEGKGSVFTSKYNCFDLVYFEFHDHIETAIKREKQLKKWKKDWKLDLIKKQNPYLRDLTDECRDFL